MVRCMHSTDENKNDPSAPPCSCGAGLSRPRHAQCTRRDSALTSHVARVVAIDPCSQCVVRGRGVVVFLSGVEQTPVFVWRVVVVGGLCARRREVQIWCGDGPCCGHFTWVSCNKRSIMMCNSSCAGLQPQRGHSSSDHIDAAVSSWVVSEPRTEAQRGLSLGR